MVTRNLAYTSNVMFGTTLFDRDWNYFVQKTNIPGINFQNIQLSKGFTNFPLQGDTPTYDTLQLQLLCDENLKVWKELIHLSQLMTNPENSDAMIKNFEAFLFIFNEQDKLILNLRFHSCQFQSVGSVDFDTTSDALLYIPVTIEYAYFEIVNDAQEQIAPDKIKYLKDTIILHSKKELEL